MMTTDEHVSTVYDIIGQSLALCRSEPFPEFCRLVERVVADRRPSTGSLPWLLLPIFTCEALEGDLRQAHHVAAALEMGRVAAGCLDEWQDHDTDDALWQAVGAERAVNLSTGVIALALLTLTRLADLGAEPAVILELQKGFQLTLLRMCEGQHADLGKDRQLDDYEAIAGAKSGSLFRLGCRAGALVAGAPAEVVDLYGGLGHDLGVLIQMWNDFQGLAGRQGKRDTEQQRALPILAGLALDQGAYDPLSIGGQAGQLYALVRLQLFHQRAAEALARCPAPGRLASFLNSYSTHRLVEQAARIGSQREEKDAP